MAIVNIDYVKKGRYERKGAKENVKYMENRPGKDGAKIQRPLFTSSGHVTRLQVYEMIDAAEPGSTFFRVKISPDPKKENMNHDLLLREITKRTMDMEERLGRSVTWVAAIHDDHTSIAHVHVLAVAKTRKLPAWDMITAATAACQEQRLELDKAKGLTKDRAQEGRVWQRERSK